MATCVYFLKFKANLKGFARKQISPLRKRKKGFLSKRHNRIPYNLNKHHTLENTGKILEKTYKRCFLLMLQTFNSRTFTQDKKEIWLWPQICQSGNRVFSQARPSRSAPRHGCCPHRKGHCVETMAAPDWPIETPPTSGCWALPPNGQSAVRDVNT